MALYFFKYILVRSRFFDNVSPFGIHVLYSLSPVSQLFRACNQPSHTRMQCLGHDEKDDPLTTPLLAAKIAGLLFLSVILPLVSLCCCCCCGGGGNAKALEQSFAVKERKLRDELANLDRLKADADVQVDTLWVLVLNGRQPLFAWRRLEENDDLCFRSLV